MQVSLVILAPEKTKTFYTWICWTVKNKEHGCKIKHICYGYLSKGSLRPLIMQTTSVPRF